MRYILLGILTIFLRIDIAIGDKSQPYICLDARSDLPNCNFTSMNTDNVNTNHERISTEKYSLKNPVEGFESETIIYRLEGCRPSRLPFEHPSCTKKDLTNPAVEVHIIFPFKISNGKSDETREAPLVFPKIIKNFRRFQSTNPTHIIWSYEDKDNKNIPVKKSEFKSRKHEKPFNTQTNKLFVRSLVLDDTPLPNTYKTKHRHRHNQLETELRDNSEIDSLLFQRYIENVKSNVHNLHYKQTVQQNIDNIVPMLFPYEKAIQIDKSKYQDLKNYNKNEYKLKKDNVIKINSDTTDFLTQRLLKNSKKR